MMRIVNIFYLICIFCSSCTSFQVPQFGYEQFMPPPETQIEGQNLPSLPIPEISKNKIRVAILLPLSGKNQKLGESLLNSAILSLFENDQNNILELVIFDSGDNDIIAQNAVKEIVAQNIKIVVGPLFSTSLEAVAEMIDKNKIIAFSFSNNGELMNKNGVFLMGFLPEQQIERIVDFALGKGKNSFSIIAPNNQYGLISSNILKEVVKRKDGNFITSELYLSDTDLEKTAQRITNAYIVSRRFYEGGKANQKTKITSQDKIYSDFILIPEAGAPLSRVVAALRKYNNQERDFQLLGTSMWDNMSTLKDSNLLGSWFAAPDFSAYKNFEKRYYRNFNSFPLRIDSIAYDAVAVVLTLTGDGGEGNFTIDNLINYDGDGRNGFVGIDGLFRFLPNGLVERNFAVLEVGNDEFKLIDPALDRFLKY